MSDIHHFDPNQTCDMQDYGDVAINRAGLCAYTPFWVAPDLFDPRLKSFLEFIS